MRQGRRQFVQLAAGLWAAGFGCLGALLARPWWQQCSDAAGSSYVALLSGMAAAFGWAGGRSACAVFGSAQQALLPSPVAKPWPGVWDVVPAILHSCLPRRVTNLAVHARSPTLPHGRPCHTCRCVDDWWVCWARRGDASAAAGRQAAQAGRRLLRGHRMRCKRTCPLYKGFTQCPCLQSRKGETLSNHRTEEALIKRPAKSWPTWERRERLALLACLHSLRCGGQPLIWHPEYLQTALSLPANPRPCYDTPFRTWCSISPPCCLRPQSAARLQQAGRSNSCKAPLCSEQSDTTPPPLAVALSPWPARPRRLVPLPAARCASAASGPPT